MSSGRSEKNINLTSTSLYVPIGDVMLAYNDVLWKQETLDLNFDLSRDQFITETAVNHIVTIGLLKRTAMSEKENLSMDLVQLPNIKIKFHPQYPYT